MNHNHKHNHKPALTIQEDHRFSPTSWPGCAQALRVAPTMPLEELRRDHIEGWRRGAVSEADQK